MRQDTRAFLRKAMRPLNILHERLITSLITEYDLVLSLGYPTKQPLIHTN